MSTKKELEFNIFLVEHNLKMLIPLLGDVSAENDDTFKRLHEELDEYQNKLDQLKIDKPEEFI